MNLICFGKYLNSYIYVFITLLILENILTTKGILFIISSID